MECSNLAQGISRDLKGFRSHAISIQYPHEPQLPLHSPALSKTLAVSSAQTSMRQPMRISLFKVLQMSNFQNPNHQNLNRLNAVQKQCKDVQRNNGTCRSPAQRRFPCIWQLEGFSRLGKRHQECRHSQPPWPPWPWPWPVETIEWRRQWQPWHPECLLYSMPLNWKQDETSCKFGQVMSSWHLLKPQPVILAAVKTVHAHV